MKHLNLENEHRALGARFTDFGGWTMPLVYTSIVKEHIHIRNSVGLFDVSHMGKILISGEEALDFLNSLSTNKLSNMIGRSRYTHLLDQTGNTIDDVIITKIDEDLFLCVCNSGRDDIIIKWLESQNSPQIITNATQDYVLLALQGPESEEILDSFTYQDLRSLKRFRAARISYQIGLKGGSEPPLKHGPESPLETKGSGHPRNHDLLRFEESPDSAVTSITSRTGYTGEDGFEILTSESGGRILWKQLLDSKTRVVLPIGLGARDTLRIEKGYLLAGQDFNGTQNPIEMGLERLVKWDHEFVGRSALLTKSKDNLRIFIGIKSAVEKIIPRKGMEIHSHKSVIGVVTSGTFSPCLQRGIGLGYVKPEFSAEGTELHLNIRSRKERISVSKLPFI